MRVITILAGLASAFVASASPHPQHTGENLNATMPIHHQQGTGRERCLIDLKGVPMPKEDLAHLIADTPSDPITVDLYFHVIYTDKTVQGGWIEDKELELQFKAIQKGYENMAVTFNWHEDQTTRNQKPEWTVFPENWWTPTGPFGSWELGWKRQLRKGDGSLKVLNIYFNPGIDGGICSLPPLEFGRPDFATHDGCIVNPNTLPQRPNPGFDEGKTAVHEIGHWFGLWHTFENECNEPGDEVSDTPPAMYPRDQNGLTYQPACDGSVNTCPDPEGTTAPDPNHNFMSYASDKCMTEFTGEQVKRAHAMWNKYRAGTGQ